MTKEELLTEDASSVYLLGMAEFTDKDRKNIAFKLLPEYKNYGDIFRQERIDSLLQHSKYDHKIELQPDTTPPFGPIYPLSEKELKALREYLEEMLAAGKDLEIQFPCCGANPLFAKTRWYSSVMYLLSGVKQNQDKELIPITINE